MKVSIWQQFSSNHSGSFSVVGRFETEEAAHEAAEKLAEIVRRIDEWHENLANQAWYSQKVNSGSRLPITPIEETISQEYAVDWGGEGGDWYGMHAPIRQTGRNVFFDTAESWASPTPIVNLLQKFGGQTATKTAFEEDIFKSIYVILTCAFASEALAQETRDLITPFTQSTRRINLPPWGAADKRPELYTGEGTVTATGNELRLEYSFHALEVGLQSVIQWLESRGASSIDYRFETRDNPTEWG